MVSKMIENMETQSPWIVKNHFGLKFPGLAVRKALHVGPVVLHRKGPMVPRYSRLRFILAQKLKVVVELPDIRIGSFQVGDGTSKFGYMISFM